MFVFNQGALQPKFSRALPVVITAGICDMILIVAAVSSVSLLVLTFGWLENIILSVGIVFLIYMGVVLWPMRVSATEIDAQTNYFCSIHFSLKPTCTARYGWCHWDGLTKLFR